jgi:hypothetical protein
LGKSEQMQSIHRYHKPAIDTEFGKRVMTQIGVIKGLEIDETVNYLLIPSKRKGEKATGWAIHRLTKDCRVDVESWNDLDKLKGDGKDE